MCLQNGGLGSLQPSAEGRVGKIFYPALMLGEFFPSSLLLPSDTECAGKIQSFHCSSCDFVSQTCKGVNRHQHVPFVLFLLAWGAPNPCPKLGKEERNPFSMGPSLPFSSKRKCPPRLAFS